MGFNPIIIEDVPATSTTISKFASHQQFHIAIYSIPGSCHVSVNSSNLNDNYFEINIYNFSGEKVKAKMQKVNQREITIEGLSSGINVIEIKSKEWTEKQILIMQR